MTNYEKILVTRSSMPSFDDYVEMIRPLWSSHWLTNMGEYHIRLENELKAFMGVKGISLLVNGHMALELAIQAMEFPEGSEVITTPFTFISTTHAIIRNRLKPVFCDIKMSDYTIDENKIEELITEKTVAILPVHVYGNLCNTDKIEEIAEKYNLKVIYDAAHAFGETRKGIGVGTFGDASVFSFHATKVFNTIEGGAVTFSDEKMYTKLYNLKNFGIRSEEVIAEIGANAKMNEFSAAMGLCNLKDIQGNVELRKQKYNRYLCNLSDIEELTLLKKDEKDIAYTYGYFPVLFNEELCGKNIRNTVYEKLRDKNIFSRKYFYPITCDASCFKNKFKNIDVTNARYVGNNILVLPLYPELDDEIIDLICQEIKKILCDQLFLKN